MGKIIGIDLGTTNARVAVMDGGEAVVLPNADGRRTTPAVIVFTEQGERIVGQVAKRQAVTNCQNTVSSIKRLIGRRFDSDEAKDERSRASHKVLKSASSEQAWVEIRGRAYSPQEISALILMKMKDTAEDYLGESVTEAVITVPAYFNDAQRRATRDAANIAGLRVHRIINDPTAAALAYGLDKRDTTTVAVYDLGGGTFDVSILEVGQGVFEVKSTRGDTHLGGDDFDLSLVNYIADQFALEHPDLDLRQDKIAMQRLRAAAEKAKRELSASTETNVNLPFIMTDARGPKHVNLTLTRERLEALVEDLVRRTLVQCEEALRDANLEPREIDEVILVGGQTRMPRIRQVVRNFFGREPAKNINADKVVAIGAAVRGGVLQGNVQDVLLLDVNPLSLGVETAGGVFTPIIHRNTTLPAKESMILSTAQDHQANVDVHVLQGDRPMADDNKTLGRFQLVGIPPLPRGVPQIEVMFDIDVNGLVHVDARDQGTRKRRQIRLLTASGLSGSEIERMVSEAARSKRHDEEKKELAEARNMADGLIHTTQKSLAEYASTLTEENVADIREDLRFLQRAYEVDDLKKLRTAIHRLQSSSYHLAEVTYRDAMEADDEVVPLPPRSGKWPPGGTRCRFPLLVRKNHTSLQKVQQPTTSPNSASSPPKPDGVPFVNLADFEIDTDVIDLVPRALAQKHHAIPVNRAGAASNDNNSDRLLQGNRINLITAQRKRRNENMDEPTTLETTRDNLAYAVRVAGAQTVLDKLVEVTVNQLRKAGVDTSFVDSEVGRSLVKVAVPTFILAAANSELLGPHVDDRTLKTARGLAELAQLAATIESMTVLAKLTETLLAELVNVRKSLPAATRQELAQLLGTENEACVPATDPR